MSATIDQRLAARAAASPDHPALEGRGPPTTYGALDAAVSRAAATLHREGVGPGSRVVVCMTRGRGTIVTMLGAMRAGAVLVPVNDRCTADELAFLVADAEPAAMVVDPDGRAPLAANTSRAVRVLAADPGAGLAGDSSRVVPPPPRPNDLACLLYTSGTTGRPKGARLRHRHLAANAAALHEAWAWREEDRLLHVLPLFHVHGLLVALGGALWAGATMCLADRFDPAEVWRALPGRRITVFMGVPTMYHRLIAAAPDDAAKAAGGVRLFTCGSAPLSPRDGEGFGALTGRPIVERYGLSETLIVTSNPLGGARPGIVGFDLPGTSTRLADPATEAPIDPREVAAVGEVQVRGPSVCDGYWRRPEATAALFTADGWLRTGDLGRREPDGALRLVGRSKELVISGGFNVYPLEVEAVLAAHPDVAEAAVVGVPDDDLGEAVAAAVVTRRPVVEPAFVDDVRAHCRRHLAAYKVPRRLVLLDALPRNTMGKVAKASLADHPALRNGTGRAPPAAPRGAGGGTSHS